MRFKYQPGDLIVYIPCNNPNDSSDINIIIRHELDPDEEFDEYYVFEVKTQEYTTWNRRFVERPDSWKLVG